MSRSTLLAAVLGIAFGALALPGLIYLVGAAILGRYEGGSVARTYQGVLGGLGHGSVSSWVVVLGPWLLWLLARLLRAWWRAGSTSAAAQ